MMNGTLTTQRHTMMDYRTVSQGRSSVQPAAGRPWYSDDRAAPEQVPRGWPHDATRSLMLDIPSMSPGGGGPGLRQGERPLSASKQHLLTVATPPPSTDMSTINPELRQAQKSGDLYNISVNLNALQLAARPQSSASDTASMRRTKSMQDIAANWSYRPPSTTPNDDQEAGTTVVQVRREDDEQSPHTLPVSMSTLPTTQRQTKPRTKSPSVRTLHIPPSSDHRSRSASRTSGGPDEGYVIKSLKSTTENVSSGRDSSTRLSSVVGDSKIVFDVELTEQQRRQQQLSDIEQSSSQQVLNVASSGHRSLLIESVTPSSTIGRQPLEPSDAAEPTYTMTMNQKMTMNYEPPLPPSQPLQQDIDETVYERTLHLVPDTTRSDVTFRSYVKGYGYETLEHPMQNAPEERILSNGRLAGAQLSPAAGRKKKQPRIVNSGTQTPVDRPKTKDISDDEAIVRSKKSKTNSPRKTHVDKSTQMKPKAKDISDDEPIVRSKKSKTNSPRITPVDKSTQMKPKTDKSDDEPIGRSKKPKTNSPRKTPEPRMVSQATQMAVNKSTQIKKSKDDDNDTETISDVEPQAGRMRPRKTQKEESKPGESKPEPRMVSRATQMAVNKSTQIKKSKDNDDSDTETISDVQPQADRTRPRKLQKAKQLEAASRKTTPEVGGQVTTENVPLDENYGPRGPVNGYQDDSQLSGVEEEIRPQSRKRLETMIPDWSDGESDLERSDTRPRQQQISPRRRSSGVQRLDRSPDDPDAFSMRQSSYGPDVVDSGPDRRGRSSRVPDDEDVVDDYISPSSVPRQQPQYPSDHPSDSDDDAHTSRRRYPVDGVDGTQSPDQFTDQRERFDDYGHGMDRPEGHGIDRSDNWESRTEQRSGMYVRSGTDRDAATDAERYTVIPVKSSAFNEQDEAYLQRRRLNASARQSPQRRSGVVTGRRTKKEEAKALLDSATQRMSTVETHFGYEGSREAFVERLMHGAPQGSVIQFEHTEREEEEIFGPLSSRYSHEHGSTVDDSAMLNFDTVSEKVDLLVSNGMAELTVRVRCERIVPVRGAVADLFKKTSIIVTRMIEVNLSVTADRQILYDHIINKQRQTTTGRLHTKDTFDLYKTFVAMAETDEASGRQRPHEVRIDQEVDEQRLLDLQITAFRAPLSLTGAAADFRRVDGRLPDVDAEDVDFRSRGHQGPIDSRTASTSVMAASRSRQLFYQS